MSDNKKHSGSFYRKRKAQAIEDNKKQAESFKKFIVVDPLNNIKAIHNPRSSDENIQNLDVDEDKQVDTIEDDYSQKKDELILVCLQLFSKLFSEGLFNRFTNFFLPSLCQN